MKRDRLVVYIVECIFDGSQSQVSSEGYFSLKDAQKFIEEKSINTEKIGEYNYKCGRYEYRIHDVLIRGL